MPSSPGKRQRETLLHLWNIGIHNAKELHTRTKVPLSTIYENIKKLKKNNSLEHLGGNGRPGKITKEAAILLGQYIRRDPTISTRTLAIKLLEKGINVSYRTIARHLSSIGYKKNLPKATPMLTEVHKQKRVEWAQKYRNKHWNRVLFSDETAFQLFRNTVERWYKDVLPIRPMPKDRRKIFAWGGFCVMGKTSLFCFRQTMDAELYVKILEKHLPEINRMLGDRWRFQQDNDPKHTSHLAQDFLENHFPEVIEWPSNSPDLNPIENLWNIVKNKVEKRMPKNLNDLERFMAEEWNNIPKTVLTNLIKSMKHRCDLIIESGGERISY